MFLRVVERHPDGIAVRGAKAHQTGAVFAPEILLMPTISMHEDDKDHAVALAMPNNTGGDNSYSGPQVLRCAGTGMQHHGHGQRYVWWARSAVICDDVLVPSDRIFIDGEWQLSRDLVDRSAGYHRQSYGGCKVGAGAILIGAAALATEHLGVATASLTGVRDLGCYGPNNSTRIV